MAAPWKTLKLRLPPRLARRIEAMGRQLDVNAEQFAQFALGEELARQERALGQEQAKVEAVRRRVLAAGQSAELYHAEEAGEHGTCELCLQTLPPGPHYDGPVLCDACFALAQGIRLPEGQAAR